MRVILLQVFFFTLVFNAMSWLRERSMLAHEQQLSNEQLSFELLSGKALSLSDRLEPGQKAVLYFFAPWCQVCRFSIGNLETLHQQRPDLQIVAVALDYANSDEVREFVAEHRLTFPVAMGSAQQKMDFNIRGYPSYYVLNNQRQVQAKSMGYSSKTGLLLRTL